MRTGVDVVASAPVIAGLVGYLGDYNAEVGIVLGSGLGGFVDSLFIEEEIAFQEVEGIPASTVRGHVGRFLFAHLGDAPLIVAQGRVHLYEGHPASGVTAGVRFMAECGVRKIVLTNAAGALNPDFSIGSWMMLSDHLNLTGHSPFTASCEGFPDMSAVYTDGWGSQFVNVASERAQPLFQGVYAGVAGPQYETPAEVRMLRALGADAVGMSTVLEAMQAHSLGVEVVALSYLTNWGAGIGLEALSHDDVLRSGEAAGEDLAVLLASVLRASPPAGSEKKRPSR